MNKQIAYFLIITSILLLSIDFYNEGLDFSKGRLLRNTSSVLLIFVAIIGLKNLKKK